MIDRDVEESLDLGRVQVDEQGTVGARGGQQIGNQLGADGDTGTVLAVLTRIPVIRNDGGDPGGRCTFESIDHHEQFQQVLIYRVAGGLHNEHVYAAHVIEQLKVNFAVSKALQLCFANLYADVAGDLFGERAIGRAAEELEAPVFAEITARLRSGAGFPLCDFASGPAGGVGPLPAPSLVSPEPGCCFSSNAVVVDPTSISNTSKLVSFGCIQFLRGASAGFWLGDLDSNQDKCLQRALSYH